MPPIRWSDFERVEELAICRGCGRAVEVRFRYPGESDCYCVRCWSGVREKPAGPAQPRLL